MFSPMYSQGRDMPMFLTPLLDQNGDLPGSIPPYFFSPY